MSDLMGYTSRQTAGIPVVQPATAPSRNCDITGGGIIYSPDTVEELGMSFSGMNDKELRTRFEDGTDTVKRALRKCRSTFGVYPDMNE
jgi:hypothetical protein